MQNRTIPYGFTVQNGKVQAEPGEAQIVRSVFEHYCFGATLQEIAEDLKMNNVNKRMKRKIFELFSGHLQCLLHSL